MSKLIAKYRATPTLANAQKLRTYERTHMMSMCMLSPKDASLIADAIHHANQGD